MKKIGFVLGMLLASSCAYENVDKNTYIEKDVFDQVISKNTATDTLYMFKDVERNSGYHYYFKQNKQKQLELAYKYEAIPFFISMPAHYFSLVLLVMAFLGYATAFYIMDQNKLK